MFRKRGPEKGTGPNGTARGVFLVVGAERWDARAGACAGGGPRRGSKSKGSGKAAFKNSM